MAYGLRDQGSGDLAEPIAIVGAGCKLPGGVSSPQELLAALQEGRDCVTEVPADRWSTDAFYDPDAVAPGKTYVRHGGFVSEIDQFDAGFFRITDLEAARMDPQQRLVLETVWHALEDAGQSAAELEGSSTGVFLAMMNTNNYSQLKSVYEGLPGITGYDAMSDAMSITAGRIAHFLGVEGPCLALDTACSSSLVALHLARQSILVGDCDAAIVVGVNAILHPGIHIAFSKVGLMSRAGRCAAFDASADGYIRGEGCVAVLLRRQSLAVARGDHIIASIVGTAVNQDGRTPALTAPNGRAQEKVIRLALARVGVSPTEVDYVEAHGTGTPVGDPIEMSAIANVFGPGRAHNEPLFVGSAKSNFGHIEAGAGLLGVLKAALSLEHEMIFPSLHFKQLNPNIDLGHAPIQVAASNIPWVRGERRRMAGINSFGYSGTNAHAILQEAPSASNGEASFSGGANSIARESELVLLSSKTGERLEKQVDNWLNWLGQDDKTALRDIAFTAATGRTHLTHRLAVVANSKQDLVEKLRAWRDGRVPRGLSAGQFMARRRPKIAFMFTGQGAQYPEMGRQLYASEERFAKAIDDVAAVMDPELGVPLKEVLFGEASATYLDNTRYVQPALFAIEYALADLLRHWGVEPDFVIGHSVGEIVAACVAGMLDLGDAVRFVVARGRLMGGLPQGGKMLAIGASVDQARAWVNGREADVSIATVNGPFAVVVSGRAEAVDAVAELAQAAGRRTKELEVSHAFHSPLMDPILDELSQVAASMRISPARIPLVSNVTGQFMADDISGEYWSSHVRQAVLFHEGLKQIVEAGCKLFIEVGPQPALTPAVATSFDADQIQTVPTLIRDKKDLPNMLAALGAVHVGGIPLNLERLFWSLLYRRVSLPLYPFRRDRHWLQGNGILQEVPVEKGAAQQPLHPILGQAVTIGPRRAVFQTGLATSSPWTDHRVLGTTVFPGTGYLEMAARGFAAANGEAWQPVTLKDVSFERPLVLRYGKQNQVTLALDRAANGNAATSFAISAADGSPHTFCRGQLSPGSTRSERVSLETLLSHKSSEMGVGPFYGELRKNGMEYGAKFATVRELWLGPEGSGEAFGRISASLMKSDGEDDPYSNAVLLDGCLQVFGAALSMQGAAAAHGAYVPASIQSVALNRELPSQVWSHVTVTMNEDGRAALVNIRVLSDEGEVVADISGLELRQMLSLNPGSSNGAVAKGTTSAFRSKSRDELITQLRDLPKHKRIVELSRWLAAEVKDTMGQAAEGLDLDNIHPSTVFLEIGLDSLLVTELQRRIQEKLEFRFQPMQGLDYQSIESLAEFIHDEVLAQALTADTAASEEQLSAG